MAAPAPAAAPPAGIRVVLPPKDEYNNHFPGGEFDAAALNINPGELLQNQHFQLDGAPYEIPMPPFGLIVQDGRLRTEVRVRFPDGDELVFPIDAKIIKKPNAHFEGFYIELQTDDQGQPVLIPPQNGGRRRARSVRRSNCRFSRRHRGRRVTRRR